MTDPVWRARAGTPGDVAEIVSLINAHSRSQCGEDRVGLGEVRSWFQAPSGEQEDTMCWFEADGRMAAFAQVYKPEFPAAWDALHDAVVHPDHAEDEGLWRQVLDWCDRYQWSVLKKGASSDHGLCSGTRIYEGDAVKRAIYESRGFRHVRNETLMRVALSDAKLATGAMPEGIRVRRMDMESDLPEYALAYGEAFKDHWGYSEVPEEDWVVRKKAEFAGWGEMFVPDLWFVAVEGDTIVGSVGSFLDHGNVKGRCYLYHVFVRRAWRNRRIASTLMGTAFRSLIERGGKTVELHVDSENITYGLELYRGMGMRPVWSQRLYERTLPASARP